MQKQTPFTQIVYVNRLCSFVGNDSPAEVVRLLRVNSTFNEALSLYCHEMWCALSQRRIASVFEQFSTLAQPMTDPYIKLFTELLTAKEKTNSSSNGNSKLWFFQQCLRLGKLNPNIRIPVILAKPVANIQNGGADEPVVELLPLLCVAAQHAGSQPALRMLLAHPDIDTDICDGPKQRRPLYFACRESAAENVEILLTEKRSVININATTRDRHWTALAAAANCGCVKNVQLLLDAGADFMIPQVQGLRPLDIATRRNFWVIVKLLVRAGDDFTNASRWSSAPFQDAIMQNRRCALAMLEAAVEPNSKLNKEALCAAISRFVFLGAQKVIDVLFVVDDDEAAPIIELLLRLGIDPNQGSLVRPTGFANATMMSNRKKSIVAFLTDPRTQIDDSVLAFVTKDGNSRSEYLELVKKAGRKDIEERIFAINASKEQ